MFGVVLQEYSLEKKIFEQEVSYRAIPKTWGFAERIMIFRQLPTNLRRLYSQQSSSLITESATP